MNSSLKSCALLVFLWINAAGPVGWAQTPYSYTGAVQTYNVPACAVFLNVDVIGASGSDYVASTGGKGGRVQAKIPVNAGETLNIYVGGAASQGTGGWNGGGTGTIAGGGGASDIRRGSSLNGRLVVAGGGGGAGYPAGCPNNSHGGNGGGLIGQNGWWCGDPGNGVSFTGKGGTQTSGGAGSSTGGGQPGSLGTGGNAGAQGGSGGGGWYGGGGSNSTGGGGGGSSYTVPGSENVSHTQGHQVGSGRITILSAQTGTPAPLNVTGRTKVCALDTAWYTATEVASATLYKWTLPPDAVILEGDSSNRVLVQWGNTGGDVTVAAESSCGPGVPKSLKVNIELLPEAGFSSLDTGYTDSLIMFLDTSRHATDWYWEFGDGNTSTVQNPLHIYDSAGTFQVMLVAGNDLCADTFYKDLVILGPTSGMERKSGSEKDLITIYPNPVQQTLNLIFQEARIGGLRIVLMDLKGQVLLEQNIMGPELILDLGYLADGAYLLKLENVSMFHLERIIIQK